MAMITSWTKQQQPISVILVALIAGFALLPAGSVAQPPNDQATATVLDQLRSGACRSPDSSSLHLCVEEFGSHEGGVCCLRLSKDCLCSIQEKQAVLNIQGPKLCGSLTGDCTARLERRRPRQLSKERSS